ncbi:MAG: hypothetical protein RI967_2135 [Planctomycetota bacterium]
MIDATYLGNGAYQTHRAGFSAALSWDSSAAVTTYNLKLSEHNWSVKGEAVTTWCVQIFQGLTAGSTYQFDVVEAEMVPQAPPAPGPMGMTKANLLRDAAARWLGADGRVVASAGNANAAAAAFSTLLWEVTHENLGTTDIATARDRLSLDLGAFRAILTGEAATIYGKMVASLGQGGWLTADLEGWRNGTIQDQIRLVPAPGALALLAVGLAAGRRRR